MNSNLLFVQRDTLWLEKSDMTEIGSKNFVKIVSSASVSALNHLHIWPLYLLLKVCSLQTHKTVSPKKSPCDAHHNVWDIGQTHRVSISVAALSWRSVHVSPEAAVVGFYKFGGHFRCLKSVSLGQNQHSSRVMSLAVSKGDGDAPLFQGCWTVFLQSFMALARFCSQPHTTFSLNWWLSAPLISPTLSSPFLPAPLFLPFPPPHPSPPHPTPAVPGFSFDHQLVLAETACSFCQLRIIITQK